MPSIVLLNLPSPPGLDVHRDYSGAYGTAVPVRRRVYGHSGDALFPVFMPYLATALRRQGWPFHVVDAQALRLNLEDTLRAVADHAPDAVVSLVSLPSLQGDLHVLDRLRQACPRCRRVVAGTVTRTLREELLQHSAAVSPVAATYPFYAGPVIEILRGEQAGTEESTPDRGAASPPARPGDLDDLDLHVYREFPIGRYRCLFVGTRGESVNFFPVLSSVGCPYTCSYCPYPLGFGKRMIFKSPARLVEEMEFLRDEFGLRAFLFRDQVFTADPARVKSLCEAMRARRLGVQWMFETRVDRVSKELLQQVREAGCTRIHFGVETGDAERLFDLGKPGVRKTEVAEAFQHAAALGIRTAAHVIVGLPGETRRTLYSTQRFLSELDPDNTSWNLATPYPGTPLFETAERAGLLLTRDWSRYTTSDIVMRTEQMSESEIRRTVRILARRDRRRKVLRRMQRALGRRGELLYLVRRSWDKIRRLARRGAANA